MDALYYKNFLKETHFAYNGVWLVDHEKKVVGSLLVCKSCTGNLQQWTIRGRPKFLWYGMTRASEWQWWLILVLWVWKVVICNVTKNILKWNQLNDLCLTAVKFPHLLYYLIFLCQMLQTKRIFTVQTIQSIWIKKKSLFKP